MKPFATFLSEITWKMLLKTHRNYQMGNVAQLSRNSCDAALRSLQSALELHWNNSHLCVNWAETALHLLWSAAGPLNCTEIALWSCSGIALHLLRSAAGPWNCTEIALFSCSRIALDLLWSAAGPLNCTEIALWSCYGIALHLLWSAAAPINCSEIAL